MTFLREDICQNIKISPTFLRNILLQKFVYIDPHLDEELLDGGLLDLLDGQLDSLRLQPRLLVRRSAPAGMTAAAPAIVPLFAAAGAAAGQHREVVTKGRVGVRAAVARAVVVAIARR